MKLISDIINDLVDIQSDLSSALLKTKVLASRISNQELAAWEEKELNGYGVDENLPKYRIGDARVMMNILIGRAQLTNQPVPMAGMEDHIIDALQLVELRETIATLQSYTKIKEGQVLSLSVSAEVVGYVENYLKRHYEYYPSLNVISLSKLFAPHGAVEVLAVIRSRLLSFMLQIEKEFGNTTDIESLKSKNQQVTHIMYNTITNTGDGNTVNTGNHSTVNAKVTVSKGDFTTLEGKLSELGIHASDINALRSVIDIDTPDTSNKRFGPQVNQWLKKMLDKAIDGSWQIGIGTAGGVLAELINSYYGIK